MYKELSIEKEIEVIKNIRELKNYLFTSFESLIDNIKYSTEGTTKFLGFIKTEYDDEVRLLFENMSCNLLFKKEDEFSYRIVFVYL